MDAMDEVHERYFSHPPPMVTIPQEDFDELIRIREIVKRVIEHCFYPTGAPGLKYVGDYGLMERLEELRLIIG